jgi:multidrug/hemolysin transport system permease protein
MMRLPVQRVFAGAPQKLATDFKQHMGMELTFGNQVISPSVSILILVGAAIVFYLLALWNLSRKKN